MSEDNEQHRNLLVVGLETKQHESIQEEEEEKKGQSEYDAELSDQDEEAAEASYRS